MLFQCEETQLKLIFGRPVPYALCRVNATEDAEYGNDILAARLKSFNILPRTFAPRRSNC